MERKLVLLKIDIIDNIFIYFYSFSIIEYKNILKISDYFIFIYIFVFICRIIVFTRYLLFDLSHDGYFLFLLNQ